MASSQRVENMTTPDNSSLRSASDVNSRSRNWAGETPPPPPEMKLIFVVHSFSTKKSMQYLKYTCVKENLIQLK